MLQTNVFCGTLQVDLDTGIDMRDITGRLADLIAESGISNGLLSAAMVGSTGSLTTIEYEPGVIKDLKRAINSLAPPEAVYEHEKSWHDGNGHSHVQAAIIGPSLVLPVRNGRLRLGTWQQVVAVNHDNRARRRDLEITISGTAA
ncbi:MAG: secondary thiamine-phosphate synthase enzyme YjbQ [Desulfosudaceae bacterium]